jgi:hypothetical protein
MQLPEPPRWQLSRGLENVFVRSAIEQLFGIFVLRVSPRIQLPSCLVGVFLRPTDDMVWEVCLIIAFTVSRVAGQGTLGRWWQH